MSKYFAVVVLLLAANSVVSSDAYSPAPSLGPKSSPQPSQQWQGVYCSPPGKSESLLRFYGGCPIFSNFQKTFYRVNVGP